MIDELYIDGQKADLSDTGISLTYQSTIFSELSKIVSNYSYTIKLPKTDWNIKLIEGAIYPSSNSRYPYLVHSGMILRDGVRIVDKANVVILKIAEEIELSLTWGTSTDLSQLITDGATIKDLDWDETIEIGDNIGTEETPIISWGYDDDSYRYFNHPVIHMYQIFEKIRDKYNISIQVNGNVSQMANRLMIPLTSNNGTDKNNQLFRTSADVAIDMELVEFDSVIPIFVVGNPDTPYYFVDGIKGGDQPSIVVKAKDEPIKVNLEISNMVVDVQTLLSYTDFYISFGESKLYAESYEDLGSNVKRLHFNGTISSETDQMVIIRTGVSSDFQYYQFQTGRLTFTPEVEYFKDGAFYPYADNIPDIKITDVIKTVKTMFGLYARVENEVIYLEPYDNIYDLSQAEDWSERMIYYVSGKCDIDFHTDLAQRNTFSYKNDEVNNAENDGVIVINDKTLDSDKEAFKSEFEASENVFYLGFQSASIPIYTKDDEGKTEYNDVNPRILAQAGQLPNRVVGTFEGLQWPNLINKYYQRYIDMMTDAKYVTVDMIITPIELKEVNLYRPIYLKQYGCYFAITEIKTGDNNICSVTLIKL